MKKKKRVTMQDIADALGVSKVTVSKALNDKDGVGPELKEDILQTAEAFGYQLTKKNIEDVKEPKNIVIFLDHKYFSEDTKAYFYVKMYHMIAKYLSEMGFIGTLSTVNPMDHGKELEKTLESQNTDGIIILGNLEEEFLMKVRQVNLPRVFVDYYDEWCNTDCVLSENIYSTYEITKHLLNYGHHAIGFVGSITVTQSISDRYLGYSRALMERKIGIRQDWIIEDRDFHNEAIDFHLPEAMPTAFVCNCDETAYRFIKTLNQKGYQVPDDVSIVSFDNDIYAEISEPKLTTVAVDIEGIARTTVKLIKRKVKQLPSYTKAVSMVNGKIIFRDSVAKK
ncbi:LacI family DNA-binding transcriptional regulator [Vallitalea pronyensis]|uniref:LacI family DNA-binding transcriptional regulator n=1 Tax=Vallitalea pronyensis TaxID=1348613 RepID=A0A8J8MIU3_9FIRM|nr:LacI family DNA-binding transcriptional regulator [Vallitalea pronyensis]QUI22311.1 LacI family DNA-binding transcriptional regulator [Vallitalea pronyensis]